MKIFRWVVMALTAFVISTSAQAAPRPKLIVTLVIDQFRPDYISRFEKKLLPALQKNGEAGGLLYLTTQGAYFPQGQYDLLQCMTGPGHATILTGAYPYQHGIPLNDWFDRKASKRVYCVEDPSALLVGLEKTPAMGASPRNLRVTTLGDELKNAYPQTRVVSIALKDRSAILMGGHRADLALWFDSGSLRWITSRFYISQGGLPGWVAALNASLAPRLGKPAEWKTPQFTHASTWGKYEALASPAGLELTADAAIRALEELKLGQRANSDAPDLLSVSFSSHDYVGHQYGPYSPEIEEMTIQDDRATSKLINAVRKKIPGGLKDVWFVFTSDHGIPPIPEELAKNRVPSGRLLEQEIASAIDQRLNREFGKAPSGKWVSFYTDYNFYFDPRAMQEHARERETIERAAKEVASAFEGVSHAFTRSDYQKRLLPPAMFERKILKTYLDDRSGNLILITRPAIQPGGPPSTTHFTAYSYDSTVPIAFVGAPFKKSASPRTEKAEVVDIAPTLSFVLGLVPPSGSEGRVLGEALRGE